MIRFIYVESFLVRSRKLERFENYFGVFAFHCFALYAALIVFLPVTSSAKCENYEVEKIIFLLFLKIAVESRDFIQRYFV